MIIILMMVILMRLVRISYKQMICTIIIPPRYKALNIMMDVEGRPRVVHPVSSYIDYSKDKQGFTQVFIVNLILTTTTIILILTTTTTIINHVKIFILPGKSTPAVLGEGRPPPSNP